MTQLTIEQHVEEVAGLSARQLSPEQLMPEKPLLLKGIASQWPLVQAARKSLQMAIAYLDQFDCSNKVGVFYGNPSIKGRFFYNEDLSGFNYTRGHIPLDEMLQRLKQYQHTPNPPAIYMGSTAIDQCLPELQADNDLNLSQVKAGAYVWIGNQTRIAAHHDVPNNIACVAAGRRRFTLFPPQQIHNLYIGPLDLTPAGQAISLVDFHNPDFTRFPKFHTAIEHAMVAEMEPGDAIIIPSLWWHHVESLDHFNILINYWWWQSPSFMGSPTDVLYHALLGIRDLPIHQREAWKHLFDYYIFASSTDARDHIPAHSRGVLAEMQDEIARKLRTQIINGLNH